MSLVARSARVIVITWCKGPNLQESGTQRSFMRRSLFHPGIVYRDRGHESACCKMQDANQISILRFEGDRCIYKGTPFPHVYSSSISSTSLITINILSFTNYAHESRSRITLTNHTHEYAYCSCRLSSDSTLTTRSAMCLRSSIHRFAIPCMYEIEGIITMPVRRPVVFHDY